MKPLRGAKGVLEKLVENAKTLTMECKDRCRPEEANKTAAVCHLKCRFLHLMNWPSRLLQVIGNSRQLQRWLEQARLWTNAAIAAGTRGYSRRVQRRIRVVNIVAYFAILADLAFAFQQMFWGFYAFLPVILINSALVGVALLVPFAHRFNDYAGAVLLGTAHLSAFIAFTAYLGQPAGVYLQYFVFAAAPLVIFGRERWYLSVAMLLLAFAGHLFCWAYFPADSPLIPETRAEWPALYVTSVFSTFAVIYAAIYYAYFLAEEAQQRADSLLRNILPRSIAERLTDDPQARIADRYDEASVLFLDLVGFTPLAMRLGSERTAQLLHEIVTELDALAAIHGVEKIKTIGDAYMAVSGVPDRDPAHLVKLADMALRVNRTVRQVTARNGVEFTVRIGLATGPVLAGIIGTHKFSFDIWGNTVNLAARMESSGEAGRILVPDEVYQKLRDRFEFEPAGDKDIKGIGRITTWYLSQDNS